MKKRNLWIISVLMTLGLMGVFIMQVHYIRESYKLKSELFDQNVNSALNAVVTKIQKKNAYTQINKKDTERRIRKEHDIKRRTDTIVAYKVRFRESENLRKYRQQLQILNYLNFQDSVIRENYFRPEVITEEEFRNASNIDTDNSKRISLEVTDIKDKRSGTLLGRTIQRSSGDKRVELQLGKLPDTIRYLAFSMVNMLPQLISFPSMDPDLLAKFKVEDARAQKRHEMELNHLYADTLGMEDSYSFNLVQDVATEMENPDLPLEKRLPPKEFLDTLIRKELMNKNISLTYNYRLSALRNRNEVIYQQISHQVDKESKANSYELPLFSGDLLRDPGVLYITFPNKNNLLLQNLLTTLLSSVALLLILIFVFTYTILTIIRQKKLSEMKTDFINNMTHEFKTPVATIMIASEALKDPEIVHDKDRVGRLAGIIYDENIRLGNHIERVLTVARIEKKELKFEDEPVDLNELVNAVVDSMSLQLQKRDAKLHLHLEASEGVVRGDELHLSNVIYNLIDNANKYSREQPLITIRTQNIGDQLLLSVSDEGIGMTKEQSKRIFDQFYRVPTGNLHDVKGFGLGLNYVQDIIQQMNGKIKVYSEKDKGTTFEIFLPLNR